MSLAMLLDHVGETAASGWVEEAVSQDLSARGTAARSTSQIGDALAAAAAQAAAAR
jgi:3-isopropylmalate dehydrogenase